jgi:hypothetical protein
MSSMSKIKMSPSALLPKIPPITSGYSKDNLREKRINDALRYYGLSVIIRTEDEFNHIKNFLSEDILWVDFVPQMSTKLTSIVIWSDMKDFTTGSVGCAETQKEHFIRVVEFNDFFKI